MGHSVKGLTLKTGSPQRGLCPEEPLLLLAAGFSSRLNVRAFRGQAGERAGAGVGRTVPRGLCDSTVQLNPGGCPICQLPGKDTAPTAGAERRGPSQSQDSPQGLDL